MQFRSFQNKTEYLEYLQIFLFHQYLVAGQKNILLEEYHSFELTDTLIGLFDKWVSEPVHAFCPVRQWFLTHPDETAYFKNNFPEIFKPRVAIWSDRKKTSYYKKKLQESFEFENHIAELLANKYKLDLGPYLTPEGQYELGENALGIEIKNDTLIKKYGNIYIEYQEKAQEINKEFVNSGILKNDLCRFFLIGTTDQFFIFKKERLIEILQEEKQFVKNNIPSIRGIVFKTIATSKGFVYPVKQAVKETLGLDEMVAEIKGQTHP